MAKSKSPPAKPRRASQRLVMSIDLHERSLRDLMIEHCKNGSDYITVYRGSRAELVAAGVPEAAFPTGGTVAEFPVCGQPCGGGAGSQELSGSMRSTAAGFELEIDWKSVMPYECAHPAVAELARMLLKDVSYWCGGAGGSDLAYPIEMVAADERAVDYEPRPGAPRMQITDKFREQLSAAANNLFLFVHANCEVLPVPGKAVAHPPRTSFLRLVTDNTREVGPRGGFIRPSAHG